MKNKLIVISSLILSITSCKLGLTDYQKKCYQCFYGNEIELKLDYKYSLGGNKKLLQNEIKDHEDEEYYFDYYLINNNKDLDSFYALDSLVVKDEDRNHLSLESESSEIVFFCQIPKGYKAYKRDNIQYQVNESKEIFLTNNFYFYKTIEDIAFCYFDVKKDEGIEDNYIYSFVIKMHLDFNTFAKNTKIRGIISDHAYTMQK